MRYLLVLQFHSEEIEDFDELVALEGLLIDRLPPRSKVDGHDSGRGEFNIFVFTDEPIESFRDIEKTIQHHFPSRIFKAAYRAIEQDAYIILSPPDLKDFSIG